MAAVAFALVSAQSHAGLLIDGFFSFIFVPASQGQLALNGNYALSFDDSVLTGVGAEQINNVSLSSFGLTTGAVGATTFDTSNTAARLNFDSGMLSSIVLGGLTNASSSPNPVSSVQSSWDDFSVSIQNSAFGFVSAAYSAASQSGLDSVNFGFANVNVQRMQADPQSDVPTPGTLLLLTSGALSLISATSSRRRLREISV
ncbi:MAG: hypothetical protein AAGG55_07000 [Pseudomonadota bacterium]